MNIKNNIRTIIIAYFLCMSFIFYFIIKYDSDFSRTIFLLILNLISFAFIWLSYFKLNYKSFNAFGIPVFLFCSYFLYRILPITSEEYSVILKCMIGLLHVLLFFVTGTFKSSKSIK